MPYPVILIAIDCSYCSDERGRNEIRSWEEEYSGSVRGGIGSITILIPSSTNAKVTVDQGLGSIRMPDEYDREDDTYTWRL